MLHIAPHRLRTHVHKLAGEIGERNVYHPQALDAAAAYIRVEWSAQGYPVGSQPYEVKGLSCENLEVSRVGNGRAREIISHRRPLRLGQRTAFEPDQSFEWLHATHSARQRPVAQVRT